MINPRATKTIQAEEQQMTSKTEGFRDFPHQSVSKFMYLFVPDGIAHMSWGFNLCRVTENKCKDIVTPTESSGVFKAMYITMCSCAFFPSGGQQGVRDKAVPPRLDRQKSCACATVSDHVCVRRSLQNE